MTAARHLACAIAVAGATVALCAAPAVAAEAAPTSIGDLIAAPLAADPTGDVAHGIDIKGVQFP